MINEELIKKIEIELKKLNISTADFELVRTTNSEFGDFTTNIALRIANKRKQSPMDFARELSDSFQDLAQVKKLEVKRPGFINFYMTDAFWQKQVSDVLKEKDIYGANEFGTGKKARVEFVSANPTGPLHFGNARGGPIGDSLASVLEFSGYDVFREYIHNDVGGQVQKLGESIVNVEVGKKLEDQEYSGEYIRDLAKKVGKVKTTQEAGKKAVLLILDSILQDCADIGIEFDEIFSESDFFDKGETKKALDKLEKNKKLKKKDGATWFAPNDKFLKDQEAVVVKSDGSYTYFANDIAYHSLKYEDHPDLVIDVFGSNHHGHVPRLQAAIEAMGNDASTFNVILYQWVRFKENGKMVKMSKRAGTFVTAREILEDVGRDALRFFILMHDANTHIDFDLDLAREKSKKNPVYYVQYAHARIASILTKAKSYKS